MTVCLFIYSFIYLLNCEVWLRSVHFLANLPFEELIIVTSTRNAFKSLDIHIYVLFTMSGVLKSLRSEKDGDIHFQQKLKRFLKSTPTKLWIMGIKYVFALCFYSIYEGAVNLTFIYINCTILWYFVHVTFVVVCSFVVNINKKAFTIYTDALHTHNS